jgi:hypothetical protein
MSTAAAISNPRGNGDFLPRGPRLRAQTVISPGGADSRNPAWNEGVSPQADTFSQRQFVIFR